MRLIKLFLLFLLSFNLWATWQNPNYLDNFVSPFNTNAKFIFLGGTAATATSWISHDSYAYEKRISYRESQPFKQFGVIGAYVGIGALNAGYIGANYYYGKTNNNEKYLKRSRLMLQATAYPMLWTMLLKTMVAFASYVAGEHGWWWGSSAYLLAGFIAISRINDEFHYLHDTLAGATIGASYGWGIYMLNQAHGSDTVLSSIQPILDFNLEAYGLTYQYTF